MAVYNKHVFVCTQQKPPGVPCCGAKGGTEVLAAFREEVAKQGLSAEVGVTSCGSIGLCDVGPNAIVYPEGVYYTGLSVADVPKIVTEHLKEGRIVADLTWSEEQVKTRFAENRARMAAAKK